MFVLYVLWCGAVEQNPPPGLEVQYCEEVEWFGLSGVHGGTFFFFLVTCDFSRIGEERHNLFLPLGLVEQCCLFFVMIGVGGWGAFISTG